jgi:hypothetical protein
MELLIECTSAKGFDQHIDHAEFIPRVGEAVTLYNTLEKHTTIVRHVTHVEYDFCAGRIYVSTR